MDTSLPPRAAIAGIGGFGGSHHSVFEKLEAQGRARVAATCDPALDRLKEACERLRFAERKVRTYTSFDDMLAREEGNLDIGVIATPHHFHAEMHEKFIRQKIACYLEKPPTLDPEEFQRMLAVEKQAVRATNVGFRFVHDSSRIALKERILRGEFGALKRVAFLGLSLRTPAYFQRNNWAGRLMIGDRLLLDSCLGNAMSHFINSMLFFAGIAHPRQWARPREMASELYRANQIEGTDTIFASGRLENGVDFQFAATHAVGNAGESIEEIMVFDKAVVTIRNIGDGTIERPGVPPEHFVLHKPSLDDCVGDYLEFFQGRVPHPPQTLADCLGFVETNALFYLAAGDRIHDIPPSASIRNPETGAITIPDIAAAAREFLTDSVFPSQNKNYSWGKQGGKANADELDNLPQAILKLRDRGNFKN